MKGLNTLESYSLSSYSSSSFSSSMWSSSSSFSSSSSSLSSSSSSSLVFVVVAESPPPPLLEISYAELRSKLVNYTTTHNISMEFRTISSSYSNGLASLVEKL